VTQHTATATAKPIRPAVAFAFAFATLVVIPEGNLLLNSAADHPSQQSSS
jgi:hypothetical protein